MDALKPCPFCGSDELSHGYQEPPEQGSVQCHACGGAMIAEWENDAIAAWNCRPTPSRETLERMARAHFMTQAKGSVTSTIRWATWDECCEIPGWLDLQVDLMAAAVEAMG